VCVMAKKESMELFAEFEKLFGVLTLGKGTTAEDPQAPEIQRMVDEREAARKRRDFKAADGIRDKLKAMGIIIEDGAEGVKWKRA